MRDQACDEDVGRILNGMAFAMPELPLSAHQILALT
jgi:hypothetical protein